MYYRIAEIVLDSQVKWEAFSGFVCEPEKPDVVLELSDDRSLISPGQDVISGRIAHRRIPGGWFFHSPGDDSWGLVSSWDYARLSLINPETPVLELKVAEKAEWFVRIALECLLIRRGYVTLHAAAVELRGKAYAFIGPSGMGKSTRAGAWNEAFGAELLSGDRPLVNVAQSEVCGVPWDGKEKCYRNVRVPLEVICEVRRSSTVYVRTMSFDQRRRLLLRQSFVPMWDTETAAMQMVNITRMAAGIKMVRVFCGPTAEDARKLYCILDREDYLKEEADMKAKTGFVMRNVVGEHVVMPVGDNIVSFKGTVILNDVAAYVWEKLQNPVSRDDILKAVLDEFNVDEKTAAADLDKLLVRLDEFGVIENE